MRVIARGRQAGKTYDLVQWVKQGEQTDSYPGWTRIILCHSLQEAQRIRKTAIYNLDYRQVFAISEWHSYLQRTTVGTVEIAVDNADLVLASFIGQSPTYITVTGSTE